MGAAMFLHDHYQNAYVTRDIERAIALLRDRFGIGDFMRYEGPQEIRTPKGPQTAMVKLALGWAGNLQYELIEPIPGSLELYREGLAGGALLSFHHICMRVTGDWTAFREQLARERQPVVQEGGSAGHLQFVYVDARDSLGHYLEYCWMTSERWAAMGGH